MLQPVILAVSQWLKIINNVSFISNFWRENSNAYHWKKNVMKGDFWRDFQTLCTSF